MNEFDEFIKNNIQPTEVPESVSKKIEETLSALPEKTEKKRAKVRILPKILATAATLVFISLFVMPNLSVNYASALEKIPVIGSIVKVVTIRNYSYSDRFHEMNIDVPKIENEGNEAADYINKDVEELTRILAERFDEELELVGDEGHSSIYVSYDIVINSDSWFTLKITVFEAAGSSNTYYKYYHIDKLKGKIVTLGDLAENDEFYIRIKDNIKLQMKDAMKEDSDLIYWIDREDFGMEFEALGPKHNFYWNQQGDLVIVYDKYEVAPGFMGTPEFAVEKEVLGDSLKQEYRTTTQQ